MRKLIGVAVLLCMVSIVGVAQEKPLPEVYGGYQFTSTDGGWHASGWNGAANLYLTPWLGGTADFSGVYKSGSNLYTYTFGPVVTTRKRDFAPFAQGISEVQRVIGAYFAPAQNASAYTSPEVAQVVQWLGTHFDAAIGQSSWGPTGFAIFASQADADRAVDRARAAGQVTAPLALRIVKGRNHGALLLR